MGAGALSSNLTGTENTATGLEALLNNTDGGANTATGVQALGNNTTGELNTANGQLALYSNTNGSENTADGESALKSNTGDGNTAVGVQALFSNTTGGSNIAVVEFAGTLLTTGDNNIDVANLGVAGESNIIRIGTQGTQTKTFVAGISGAGVTGLPVKVNAMLLNEFLKEHRKAQEQDATIAQLKSEMEALIATEKEQASQIQKVSAQLELNKPAARSVADNQ